MRPFNALYNKVLEWSSSRYAIAWLGTISFLESFIFPYPVQDFLLASMSLKNINKAYFFAFVFFRIFDVLKPYPVSIPDKRMDNALGVMLDDVLAALYPLGLFIIAMIGLSFFGMGHLPFKFLDFLMD